MSTPQFSILSLTAAAAERARDILAKAGRPVAGIRVGVKKGGCAGMEYTLALADTVAAGDEVIESAGVKLLVSPADLLFLLGTRLDFETGKISASFTFHNPNQISACGCGESVAIAPAGTTSAASSA
jgi:iron-sulfur cluster assembly protein